MKNLIIKQLLRVHESARATPYYHLDGYMLRDWVLGYRSPERNGDNPAWKRARIGKMPQSSALYRWLCRNIAIRAHTILRSDNDRHLHDHPSWSLSIVLEGGYWEVFEPTPYALQRPEIYDRLLDCLATETPDSGLCAHYGIIWRGPGAIVLRRATDFHRLILPRGTVAKSIFVMGKKSNSWGFLTPQGKVYWRTYFGLDKEQA
ncbi:hypothetical protein [Paraburkholderia atlantica]|uniref:hypothetical protein n=1 Tax=Paraburkholderia atlantica TaxID=2654982 RepID=UPI0017EED248|nr:hypothetical protein [Paraburkholderia atlantica]MBB5414080.1 hypothetical protein [Paraburkholderia atlantica]